MSGFGMFDQEVAPLEDEELRKKDIEIEDRKRRAQELDDIKTILRYPQGRRVLWRILTQCNPFANPFAKDANATAYNCGLQATGRWLYNEIFEAKTDAYTQMRNEHEAAMNNRRHKKEEEDE